MPWPLATVRERLVNRFDPSSIRAMVFDFDGTLAATNIDFALMRAEVLEVAARWGVRERVDADRYILEIVAHAMELLPDDDARARFRVDAEAAMQSVELVASQVADPFPGVPEALQSLLDAGLRVGVITRNCRTGVAAVMDRHPIPHEVLLTRDDVELVKPHPSHLHLALDELGVAADRTLMVGDHITDIETGHSAGASAAGVLTAKTTREQFEECGADFVADAVPDVAATVLRALGEG